MNDNIDAFKGPTNSIGISSRYQTRWCPVVGSTPALFWPSLNQPNVATLHTDGSPRISGIEMKFVAGEPWLAGTQLDALVERALAGPEPARHLLQDRLALLRDRIRRLHRLADLGVLVAQVEHFAEPVTLRPNGVTVGVQATDRLEPDLVKDLGIDPKNMSRLTFKDIPKDKSRWNEVWNEVKAA